MSNLLQLLRHSLQAEFPEFETLQLFSIFRLSKDFQDPAASRRHVQDVDNKITRMASMLHLPEAQLSAEFHDILPAALNKFAAGNSTQESWVQAVHICSQMRARADHPCEVLSQALS
eukprot:4930247-Amphidinium_carterae.1